MHSKGDYENDGKDGVCHDGLDDDEDEGIVESGIVLSHELLHLSSHVEQTIRHEDGIYHVESHSTWI